MVITIKTSTQNGHIIVYIINSHNANILTVRDDDSGSCVLTPGKKYRLEFHMWSAQGAKYKIEGTAEPGTEGFPYIFEKEYSDAGQDFGGFYFTA